MTFSKLSALTIWQPWAGAIVHGPKRVENRSWAPHEAMIGKTIAIHAGTHQAEWPDISFCRRNGYEFPGEEAVYAAIVGVATILRVTKCRPKDPWFFGPVGWVLGDVIALPFPVTCPGAQRLWSVPDWALTKINSQLDTMAANQRR